ncbi:MAG TPA: hypothetical protein VLY24_04555 [Bryobacteraceae bacterium]|nr:hypothetical protein [Bryobacteraceae bacterium]
MKLNRRLAIALGITALFGVVAVQAQEQQRVNVPFAFELVGQSLQAGTYMAISDLGGPLRIENTATGHSLELVPVLVGLTNSDHSSMVFRCYPSECFLNQIRFAGSQRVYQVPPSKREKVLAKAVRPAVAVVAMR